MSRTSRGTWSVSDASLVGDLYEALACTTVSHRRDLEDVVSADLKSDQRAVS
jgi:hypothetical protein